jgi:predicted lipid-binding transport protein (Tim44 family)
MSLAVAIPVGILVLALIVIPWVWVLGRPALRQRRGGKRRRARERLAVLAGTEAAEDDPAFDPERVRAGAEQLFREIQSAWDRRDRERLGQLLSADLMNEWSRRLNGLAKKGWRNHVEVRGPVNVQYVGVVNRDEDAEDRVCVHVDATLLDVVIDRRGRRIKQRGALGETVRLSEYWTLMKPAAERRDESSPEWILLSIEQNVEGAHQLDEPLVAAPWNDTERLRERTLTEQAAEEKLPDGISVGQVAPVDFAGDARGAALDLSVADGRFAPELLEAEVRRAVAAWAEAVDGGDGALHALARADVVDQLLYPGDRTRTRRLVVRGPRVRALRITELHPKARPPTMTVELEVEGRRYVQNRDTAAIVSGDPDRSKTFIERWTLALEGDDAHPWRIVRARRPSTPAAHARSGGVSD